MKKIGIITWYWGNYGSILQALALQNVVTRLGYSAELIRHSVNGSLRMRTTYRLQNDGIRNTASYYGRECLLRLRSRFHPDPDCQIRNQVLNEFIRTQLCLSEQAYTNSSFPSCAGYDGYICGSDQIWNPDLTFFSDYYWLQFVKSGLKISYAPSIGAKGIPQRYHDRVKLLLSDFTAISVREEQSRRVLNALLPGRDIQTVLDPALLLTRADWDAQLPEPEAAEPCLFACLLRGDSAQRAYIQSIARQRHLKLVVYPKLERRNQDAEEASWGTERIFTDTPYDFINRIKHAALVLTDSFHCSVFSLIYHTEFYVLQKNFDHTGQLGRLEHLLSMTGQQQRLISVGASLEQCPCSFEGVDERLQDARSHSMQFLKTALEQK